MNDVQGDGYAVAATTAFARKRRRGVFFVIGTLDLGGTESQLVLLAKELKKRGWRVEVFALSQGGVLAEPLHRDGIPVFCGFQHSLNAAPTSPSSLRRRCEC